MNGPSDLISAIPMESAAAVSVVSQLCSRSLLTVGAEIIKYVLRVQSADHWTKVSIRVSDSRTPQVISMKYLMRIALVHLVDPLESSYHPFSGPSRLASSLPVPHAPRAGYTDRPSSASGQTGRHSGIRIPCSRR